MPALGRKAAGPGGGLFPAPAAGITLTAAGDEGAVLELAGAYRPRRCVLPATVSTGRSCTGWLQQRRAPS